MNEQFKEYLKKHTAPSTADRYIREINRFFQASERIKTDPKTANYTQIIAYIGERREQFQKSSSIGCTLHAIKHYYKYHPLYHFSISDYSPYSHKDFPKL